MDYKNYLLNILKIANVNYNIFLKLVNSYLSYDIYYLLLIQLDFLARKREIKKFLKKLFNSQYYKVIFYFKYYYKLNYIQYFEYYIK